MAALVIRAPDDVALILAALTRAQKDEPVSFMYDAHNGLSISQTGSALVFPVYAPAGSHGVVWAMVESPALLRKAFKAMHASPVIVSIQTAAPDAVAGVLNISDGVFASAVSCQRLLTRVPWADCPDSPYTVNIPANVASDLAATLKSMKDAETVDLCIKPHALDLQVEAYAFSAIVLATTHGDLHGKGTRVDRKALAQALQPLRGVATFKLDFDDRGVCMGSIQYMFNGAYLMQAC